MRPSVDRHSARSVTLQSEDSVQVPAWLHAAGERGPSGQWSLRFLSSRARRTPRVGRQVRCTTPRPPEFQRNDFFQYISNIA